MQNTESKPESGEPRDSQMLTTDESAKMIHGLLKTFESDPSLNKLNKSGTRDLFMAGAAAINKSAASICYVSYQGSKRVSREDAAGYAMWLLQGDRWKTAGGFPRIYRYLDDAKLYREENLFYLPALGYRPECSDQFGNIYDVGKTYFAFLDSIAPKTDKPENSDKYITKMLPHTGEFYPSGSATTWHFLDKRQQELANRLFVELCEAIRTAYARGQEHGRDLLAQLTRGEITIGQFETRVPLPVKRDVFGRIVSDESEEEQ